MKRALSFILSFCMVLSMLFVPLATMTVSAVNSVKTQDEAVAWLNAQDGASYNFSDFYDDEGNLWGGTQCVEFVRAYVNWLVNGNAWSDAWNGPTGNGDTIWQNSLWSQLGWEVYYNTDDFVPQPGDIFSSGGCHTGVVISSTVATAVVADANARNNNPYDGDSVWVHSITWRSATTYTAYGATHYIRPKFAANVHTHSYNTFAFFLKSHPHYNCYQCSCGEIETNTAEPRFYELCEECLNTVRPEKPVLKNLNSNYSPDDTISFVWEQTNNTTHYNLWIWNYNESNEWEEYEHIFYAESGTNRTLPVGYYRLDLQSYNSNYWEADNSDWLHTLGDSVYLYVDEPEQNTATISYNSNGGEGAPAPQVFDIIDDEWTDDVISGHDILEQKEQYTSRTKSTTTSSESSMPGWTLYDKQVSGYGSWSSWSSTPITATEYVEVQTKNVPATTKTVWHYSRDTGNGLSTYAIGYYGNPEHIDLDYRLSAKGVVDGYTRYGSYGTYLKDYWWNEWSETVVDQPAYTAYSSRDIYYTHYYYKWSDWSEYSDTAIEASDSVEVKTRTVYKYNPAVTLSDVIPTREGYTFLGWSTDKYATEPEVLAGGAFTVNADTTLYAVWETACTHEHTEVRNATESTCNKAGYSGDTYCSDCGELIANGTVLALAAHSFALSDTPPTCTSDGYTTYTCRNCGHSFTDNVIPMLGHDMKITVFAPTASAQGYTLHKCTRCDYSFKDNYTDPIPDENAPKIVIENKTVRAGETFTVDIVFENNPGINSFSLEFVYDKEVLSLDNVECNSQLGGQFAYVKKAVWIAGQDTDFNGAALTLTFTALEDAVIGDTSVGISYAAGDISNYNEDDVDFAVISGIVSVIDYISGDINGDGAVNNKDLTRLLRYLAGDSVSFVEKALDVNGDGTVNNKDLTRLLRFLAGDGVEIY